MYMERVKTPEELFFFFFFWALRFVKVEASQGPCQCKTVLALCVCAREIALGSTNGGRGGSQTGQLAADSGGEVRRRKSPSPRSPLFQQ